MSKKMSGWIIGTVVFLGVGGCVLARYNTNSMAHVFYQQIVHSKTDSLPKKKNKSSLKTKVEKDQTSSFKKGDISQLLKDKSYVGSYATVANGKISRTHYVGKGAKQNHNKYYLATDTENMLTAAAVLQLVDQGKLKLSTPINKYYDSLSTSDKVTVQTLLDMTSGLSNDSIPNNQLMNVLNWNLNHVELGTTGQYNYQEVNYVLLEGIISQVTNQSYQDYITNTFLKPSKLDETKFASQVDGSKMAVPYSNGQLVDNSTLAKAMNGQMGQNQLVATPKDLLKLTQFLVKKYGNNPNFIGKQPSGRLIRDGDMYYVSGKIVGYRTAIAISKDGKQGIVLMSNDSNGKNDLTSLVKKAYADLK